ncbi:hypothetical protein C9374_007533 [Naegleria lovaniensis]|uniref:Uncharacterized protein n=1 Tax=Naegleria lovaniensis TaxID=51637 RepID=A0AA88KLX2_NAELO|nr:uncharacterized protein C9374_007533 [Naegleria lovaniensis]KAG2379394.1 hypothetical protein C9374_007533 [Naegleria lovaniensis]
MKTLPTYERDFRYFSFYLDTNYPLVPPVVPQIQNENQQGQATTSGNSSETTNENTSIPQDPSALLELELSERENLLETLYGHLPLIEQNPTVDPTRFKILNFNEVLQLAKTQKFEEYAEYEKNLAEETKLSSGAATNKKPKEVESEEEIKKKIVKLKNDRKRLIALIYRRSINFHIEDFIKKKAEEEKKKQIELQKKEEEKRKEREKANNANKKNTTATTTNPTQSEAPPPTEERPNSRDSSTSQQPQEATPLTKNSPILFFLFKDYPTNSEEANQLVDAGVNFDCIVVLKKEKKRGPPPISEEELNQKLNDKKKRPKSNDTKQRPKSGGSGAKTNNQPKKTVPPASSASSQNNPPIFEPENRLCQLVEKQQQVLQENNQANLLRNVMYIHYSFVQYIYDDDNSKFDPGDNMEREVARFFSTLVQNAQLVMNHYDSYLQDTGFQTSTYVSDDKIEVDLSYYNKLLEKVPDICCSEAVILHCLMEQLVKTVEDKFELVSNGDDKKVTQQVTESLNTLLSTTFSPYNFLQKADIAEKQSEPKNTLTKIGNVSLIPFGSKISEHSLHTIPIQQDITNVDVEKKITRMLHLFPDLDESHHDAQLESDEERITHKTEIYHFLSGKDEDIHGPYKYSKEEIDKELVLQQFERMMEERGLTYNFTDRNIQEVFSVDTLIEVISNIGLFEKPLLVSKYNQLNHSVMLAFYTDVPSCRYERISLVKRFSVKPYFLEWFSKYQDYFMQQFNNKYERQHKETYDRTVKMAQFGLEDEEHKETPRSAAMELEELPEHIITLPLPKLEKSKREELPDPKHERYIFEGKGSNLYVDTVNFYPSDGAIIYLQSEYCTSKTISCTVDKDGMIFGFKNTIKSLDNPHNVLKRNCYFSCTFEDSSTLLVYLRDQLDSTSTEVDYSCTNGLHVRLTQDGSIHQFYPAQQYSKKKIFGTGFKGLYQNETNTMTISLDSVDEIIQVWNSSTNSVDQQLVREQSVTITKSGVVIRRFENDISQVIFPNSEVHHFNAQGACLKTSPTGERCVELPDGTITPLLPIKYAKNFDAWKEAEVHVREDLVMKVIFNDGSQFVQYSDGFRVWRCPVVHGQLFVSEDEDEDEFMHVNDFYTLIERSGFATVKIIKDQMFYELPDQALFTYSSQKLYTCSKDGHIISVDLEKNFVDIEPSSLSFTSINKERFHKKSSKYYFGMYSFDYFNGGMKTIDILGHEFVVTGTGRSMIKFFNENEKSSKDIHEDRMIVEERKASRACTPRTPSRPSSSRQAIEATGENASQQTICPQDTASSVEDNGNVEKSGEQKENDNEESEEVQALSQSLIAYFKKNKVGIPPVSLIGDVPNDDSHKHLVPPRLFELSLDGRYAFEYVSESVITPIAEAAKSNPDKVTLSEDRIGEFKSVSSVHIYTKYDQGTRYLESPETVYSIPKAVMPLGKLKQLDPSIFYHRHFNRYRPLTQDERNTLKEKLQRWKEWRSKREDYVNETMSYDPEKADTRTEQLKQEEEAIKQELARIFVEKKIFDLAEPSSSSNQSQPMMPNESKEKPTALQKDKVVPKKQSKEQHGLMTNDYKEPMQSKDGVPKYWAEPEALETWKTLVLGIPKKEKKSLRNSEKQLLDNDESRTVEEVSYARNETSYDDHNEPITTEPSNTTTSQNAVQDTSMMEDHANPTAEYDHVENNEETEQFEVVHTRGANAHDPSFYDVKNVSKSVWFKKSFVPTATAIPNHDYKSLHDSSKIKVKTSSMVKKTTTIENHSLNNSLPPKNELATSMNSMYLASPSSAATTSMLSQHGLSNIQIFPNTCNFGYLVVGDVYRMSVQMINSGHVTGRFQIDYQNRSQWFAAMDGNASADSLNSTLRIYCDKGPIAPGINRKIEFEVHAIRPQKIQFDVQVRTEESIITIPVSATILSQQEFADHQYRISSRVKIAKSRPTLYKIEF